MLLKPSEKLFQTKGLTVGYAVIDCEKNDVIVPIMNVNRMDQLLLKGTTIGNLVSVEQLETNSVEKQSDRVLAAKAKAPLFLNPAWTLRCLHTIGKNS